MSVSTMVKSLLERFFQKSVFVREALWPRRLHRGELIRSGLLAFHPKTSHKWRLLHSTTISDPKIVPGPLLQDFLMNRWHPKFTFSTFTPDRNSQTLHLHKTQIYTSPNLHRSDLHKTKFTQPNIDIPKFTRLKFTQKLNPNSHRPKFTQTQIYTHIFGHRLQDFKKPKFTRTACPRVRATLVRIVLFSCHI